MSTEGCSLLSSPNDGMFFAAAESSVFAISVQFRTCAPLLSVMYSVDLDFPKL